LDNEARNEAASAERTDKTKVGTNVWRFAVQTGFFAGLIWIAVKALESYLRLTKVPSGFMAKPFFREEYLDTAAGYWMGWGVFIIFSILAALVYAAVLRKIRGPWAGLAYGAVWWIVLYGMVGPVTGMMKPAGQLDLTSAITDFCLFLLWGLFIGYSISFEFTDERGHEPSTPVA
jgi:hypothetical protein